MQTFKTPGPVALDLRVAAGAIEIEAADVVETTVRLEPLGAEASAEAVAAAEIEHSGGRLLVDVPDRRGFGSFIGRGPQVRLRVRVPEGSSVEVRTRSADVEARGSFGALDAKTASGDLAAGAVSSATVSSVSGDVRLDSVAGETEVHTASGDLHVGRSGGPLRANLVSGDLAVVEAGSSVSVRTVSGDQRIDVVREGEVSLNSVSGDIRVGIRRGSRLWVDANSVSGTMRSELELSDSPPPGDGPLVELRAKTVSGDVHVTRAAVATGSASVPAR